MHAFHIEVKFGAFTTYKRGPNIGTAIKSALKAFALHELPEEQFAHITKTVKELHRSARLNPGWMVLRIMDDTAYEDAITVKMEKF